MNRRLPGTDLELSPICLGTGGFGGSIDRQTSFAMLDRFVELGGNFLDTAHVYSNWIPGENSRSEKTIGLWLKDRQNRQNMVIGTKGAHPNLETMHLPRLSRADIQNDLEESLGHLQTDWIEIGRAHV